MFSDSQSAEVSKLRDFRLAGVNRLSLGVQSLRDDDLKFLGRYHSSNEAKLALSAAQSIFERHSFDLIYARRRAHSLDDWKQELEEALELAGGHLSLYSLTIEQGTAFAHHVAKGKCTIIDSFSSRSTHN